MPFFWGSAALRPLRYCGAAAGEANCHHPWQDCRGSTGEARQIGPREMSLEIGLPTNARATTYQQKTLLVCFFGLAVFWQMNRYLETRRALREANL